MEEITTDIGLVIKYLDTRIDGDISILYGLLNSKIEKKDIFQEVYGCKPPFKFIQKISHLIWRIVRKK